jgi:release factor glutamine methyltransferase
VVAVDASAGALTTAQNNAQQLQLPVQFLLGSWLAPVEGQQVFDLIVSNPPYIAEGDPHLTALTHEPITALTAGPDGLDDIRQIIRDAKSNLKPGGWLLLEHGYDQADAVSQLLTQAGYAQVQTRKDLGEQNRCTGGQTL